MTPRTTAIISAIAIVLIGYRIFFAAEAPGTALMVLQWALFALAIIGLVGSLVQMARR